MFSCATSFLELLIRDSRLLMEYRVAHVRAKQCLRLCTVAHDLLAALLRPYTSTTSPMRPRHVPYTPTASPTRPPRPLRTRHTHLPRRQGFYQLHGLDAHRDDAPHEPHDVLFVLAAVGVACQTAALVAAHLVLVYEPFQR